MSDVKDTNPAEQPSSKAIEANVQTRLKELTNVNRIVTNAIALITDTDVKGGHASAVTEMLGWLTGFSQSLLNQIKTLEGTLPKKPIEVSKAGDAAKPTKAESPEVEAARLKAATTKSVEPKTEPAVGPVKA